ncbi:hypothetical protein EYZ11_006557 [Aspergillus tanneri]|uniref:Uncharacterized protein n=1 Tax=Aspergillus tanneri TaxID=1220188 RepID=A0A4S3JF38_9EURO|nr:hypothetical protein EYZ11_006557 [Aspergillus tanneri]
MTVSSWLSIVKNPNISISGAGFTEVNAISSISPVLFPPAMNVPLFLYPLDEKPGMVEFRGILIVAGASAGWAEFEILSSQINP